MDSEARRAFVADSEGTIRVYQTADGKVLGEIRSNPPTIESRLITLNTQIAEQEKAPSDKLPSLPELKDSIKRWTAAQINTRALSAAREALENAQTIEQHQLDFTHSAAEITSHADALNQKRNEREQLSRMSEAHPAGEIQDELKATLMALDIRITLELEMLQQAENTLVVEAQTIDRIAPVATEKKIESLLLTTSYIKALE